MMEKLSKQVQAPKLKFMDHYRTMWPFVRPYLFRAIFAVFLSIPIGALDAVVALALKPYMDIVLVDKTAQSPAYIPLLIVAFTVVQGALNYIATYMNSWVAPKSIWTLNGPYLKNCCFCRLRFMTKMIPVISFSAFLPTPTPPVPG